MAPTGTASKTKLPPAPPRKAAAKAGKLPPKLPPKPRAKPSAARAPAADDPTLRRMKDPWFSLACAGLKTRDVRFADDDRGGGAGGPPAGFAGLKVGDVITWTNTALGFARSLRVEVTACSVTTLDEVLADMRRAPFARKAFPTVAGADNVAKVVAGMLRGKGDKPVVVFDFQPVAA